MPDADRSAAGARACRGRKPNITAGPFTITAIASAHETIEYDADGACRYLGYVLRFGIDFCILDCGARWDSSVVPECRRNPE
jgi:hypothetical protein